MRQQEEGLESLLRWWVDAVAYTSETTLTQVPFSLVANAHTSFHPPTSVTPHAASHNFSFTF
jgi:hypothetical protein